MFAGNPVNKEGGTIHILHPRAIRYGAFHPKVDWDWANLTKSTYLEFLYIPPGANYSNIIVASTGSNDHKT